MYVDRHISAEISGHRDCKRQFNSLSNLVGFETFLFQGSNFDKNTCVVTKDSENPWFVLAF